MKINKPLSYVGSSLS